MKFLHGILNGLRQIWAHKVRSSLTILGIMLGLVLGLLYYAQRQPVYESKAMILVVKKSPAESIDFARGDNRMQYMEDYMSTQSVLVKSPVIIDRAVKKPNLQDLKSLLLTSKLVV